MRAHSQIRESTSGGTTVNVPLGDGTYEILSASVVMGGTVPSVSAVPNGGRAQVRFVPSGAASTQQRVLAAGTCSDGFPLIMEGAQFVVGPGDIRGAMTYWYSDYFTLHVTYRKVVP